MKIKLVVFDLAGTTVKDNFDVPRVLQKALYDKGGVDVPLQHATDLMGIPKPIAIKKLLQDGGLTSFTEDFVEVIHRYFVDSMIDFYRFDLSVGEKPGVSKAFAALRQAGIKVAVDTGFDREITDVLLERLGWIENRLIDASITSDEVENGRPHPDMIFEAMRRTAVTDIHAVAKVGDTASDMQEGTSAGCLYVIGITTGAYTVEQLLAEPHTHLAATMEEVLAILGIR
ncbi:MAG: HAD hydrolase-like protein [Cyclobacteriaceae bacterium]|nr:HAD hydrolase-like protein [Cyclobacteriaceae bacterium]